MDSNEDDSTGRKSFHRNKRSKGSVSTVRVGSRSVPLYPLVIVSLGVLNTILLLTAVVIGIYCGKVDEESGPEQTASLLILEAKQLQIIQFGAVQAQKESEEELERERMSNKQLQQQVEQSKTLIDVIQRHLETLQVEKATLISSSSDISLNCGRCLSGWFYLNESCYFHSKAESSAVKNWADSREDCVRRGADLVVIEDWVEQVTLYEHLPKLTLSREWWRSGSGIWIGFTRQAGDTWMWVNNATLLGEGFWKPGEPNNKGPHGENCGAIMNIVNYEKTWIDGYCLDNREWLCEMGPS